MAFKKINNKKLKEMYEKRISSDEIADYFKCHKHSVYRRIRKLGLSFKNYEERIETKCNNCNKKLFIIPYDTKYKTHFCNKECMLIFQKNGGFLKNIIEVKCSYCKNILKRFKHRLKSNKNHFCNKICHNKWMSINNRGKNNNFFGKTHTNTFRLLISEKHRKLKISKENLYKLYDNKRMSTLEISKLYNVNPTTVSNLLKKYNIKIRTTSENSTGINNPMFGKNHSKEVKSRIGNLAKERWKDEEYIQNWISKNAIKPNRQEIELNNILKEKFPNEYKYVGDFKFWIDGKNPDFINVNGQKKIIELFGTYFHKIIKEDDSQKRINHFKKYGYDTLIIWSPELQKQNREKLILKIGDFHEK